MTIIYVELDLTKQHPQPQPIGHVILSIPCQWHLVAIITDLFKLVHCKNPPSLMLMVGVELRRDFNSDHTHWFQLYVNLINFSSWISSRLIWTINLDHFTICTDFKPVTKITFFLPAEINLLVFQQSCFSIVHGSLVDFIKIHASRYTIMLYTTIKLNLGHAAKPTFECFKCRNVSAHECWNRAWDREGTPLMNV